MEPDVVAQVGVPEVVMPVRKRVVAIGGFAVR